MATAEQVAEGMAQLKDRPEYGGRCAVHDLEEHQRTLASQASLEERGRQRREVQRGDEALEQLRKLQPPVCSIEGVFGAAELGNTAALDAYIKGYPIPVYDAKEGRPKPNPDRRAVPEDKHVMRAAMQLSHHSSALQHRHNTAKAAGAAEDDLRLAVGPHLYEKLRGGGGGLTQGASYDLRDEHGKTPLHLAAASGREEAVRMLLASGADPNALDREGCTPMHMAALQV